MTSKEKIMEKLKLTEDQFKHGEMAPDEISEEAYLLAEYNSILIELIMEE